MRHSFAPFGLEEALFLSAETGIDYTDVDFDTPAWLCVSARDDDGRLMGLCCFQRWEWWDWYFSIAVRDPRCITRRVMRAMFTAVFSQALRVSAEIRPERPDIVDKAVRMGFEIEGFKRLAIEGRWDALQLGMTRDQCKFLRRAPGRSQAERNEDSDGQLAQSS